MFCPSCGVQTPDSAQFCPRCGAELPKTVTLGETGTPAAESEQGQTASNYEPGAYSQSTNLPPFPSGSDGIPTYPSTPYGDGQPSWPTASGYPGPIAAFGAPLASWGQRVGALLLDILVLVVPYLIVLAIVHGRTSSVNGGSQFSTGADGATNLAFLVIQGFYFTYLNGLNKGQTLGNRVLGIAVRDINTGQPIGLGRGFLRWFIRVLLYVLVIPGLLNDLFPLWDAQRQTIADKVAKSVMVRV